MGSQECPLCHKSYSQLSQHLVITHKDQHCTHYVHFLLILMCTLFFIPFSVNAECSYINYFTNCMLHFPELCIVHLYFICFSSFTLLNSTQIHTEQWVYWWYYRNISHSEHTGDIIRRSYYSTASYRAAGLKPCRAHGLHTWTWPRETWPPGCCSRWGIINATYKLLLKLLWEVWD